MQFEFEGREWVYDPSKLNVATATAIKHHTGLGLKGWNEAVEELEPDAIQALYWTIREQNGVAGDIAALEFSIPDFIAAFTLARVAEVKTELERLEREAARNPKGTASGPRRGSTRKPTRTSAAPATSTST